MTTLDAEAAEHTGYARDDVLVEPGWLEEHLHDPGLRVVEIDVSPAAYDEGHIEGAVFWNVYRDLKDSQYRPVDAAAIERLLGRCGIEPGSTVVFYGYAPAMGLWLMKLYGHVDVRVLNCGREVWQGESHSWTSFTAELVGSRYRVPDQDVRIRADRARVQASIGDPRTAIVDVRTVAEYDGSRFWPSGGMEEGGRAGHIPSATRLSIDEFRDERGAFRTASELRSLFASLDLFGGARSSRTARSAVGRARPGSCSPTCSGATTSACTTARGPSGAGRRGLRWPRKPADLLHVPHPEN
jgi:thiosulfate/3-mercaptopyruvate sulfurtransferase